MVKRWHEVAVVATVLVVLELTIYGGYFTGSVTPAFDFHSTYNYEAYAWWHDGGLFSPPQWMPYLWGGYPAVSNLQNGSYYLPIGVVSLLGGYSIHAAAVLSALHVAFGAVGAYLVVRRFGAGMLPALFALVCWFLAIGFTANAQYLDIFRGWAWFPWLLLIASVKWPWRRWWSVPVGGLLIWQAVLGTYPGMLVAFAYCLLAWVVIQLVLFRPKLLDFLVPLAVAGIGGVLMTLIRFLPAFAERGVRAFESTDLSTFGPAHVGTMLFPYGIAQFGGGMMPLQPWFLGGAVLALLLFVVVRRDRIVVALLVPLAVAVALGLPIWPWHEAERLLPGLDLSRFRASDFKPVILGLAVFLAAFVLDRLLSSAVERGALATRPEAGGVLRRWAVPILVTVLVAVGLGVLIGRNGFPVAESVIQLALFVAAAGVVVAALLFPALAVRRGLAIGLIVIAAAAGTLSAYSGAGFWRSDRVATEIAYLGAPVGDLIAERQDPGDQRPARTPPPPPDQPQDNLAGFYSAAFYTGVPSLYGYANLRGTESFEIVRESVIFDGDEATQARRFWSAAGMLIRMEDGLPPDGDASQRCATTGDCGTGLESTPVSYRTDRLEYRVDATETMTVSANEAWYRGWRVEVCEAAGCVPLPSRRGDDGQIVFELPAGQHLVILQYELPYLRTSWAIFGAGLALLALGALGVGLRSRRLSGGSAAAAEPAPAAANPAALRG